MVWICEMELSTLCSSLVADNMGLDTTLTALLLVELSPLFPIQQPPPAVLPIYKLTSIVGTLEGSRREDTRKGAWG